MSANILIVEDEFLIACEMQSILEDNGFACVGIASDLPAAAQYFDERLDLAFVDLNLRDGLTGPEIGKQLSRSGVPVIFITANPALLGSGVAGTIGVLTKPTDEDDLLAAVRYAVNRRDADPPPRLQLFG
jgi:two-component system, response regulator PdtaR